MYQFFVEDENIVAGRVRITGDDVKHIRNVLRMKPGEKIRVSGSCASYFCHIEEIAAEEVAAVIDAEDEEGTEFAHKVYLFQGLPKGDKMDLIVQKAVELGVCEIFPVAMKNCVVKLDEKKAQGRAARWQTIARSAAMQSKRSLIPAVHKPVSWKEALALAKKMGLMTLVPYENERGLAAARDLIGHIPAGQPIGVMIGPEGGFSPEEIDAVQGEDFYRISLGRRILRTETAGPAVLAMLVYALDR